ncbi:DUF2892 domain-containing protein [Minwuia sp.]|uniref:YgaP family membrane protein n=1 Tax=Minwuia sp. TaxID=2493630 RepID=UPI003A9344BA
MPNKNMHNVDRALRLIIGLVLLWIGVIDQDIIANQLIAWALGLFGVVNIVSALMAFCPVYFMAGFSTRTKTV